MSIFPDHAHKDVAALDILLPTLQAAHRIKPELTGLKFSAVEKAFRHHQKLPLGEKWDAEIEYEGKHLITGEVIEQMKVQLPLLQTGVGAISFYVAEIEHVCQVPNLHQAVGPLIQRFLEELLFTEQTTIYDERLVRRLSDSDVREYIRAVFVPLVRERTVETTERGGASGGTSLAGWRAYQATNSEKQPVRQADKTLFNLVPCHQGLELALIEFLERAPDVVAFAKNAGPQCLRIDYLGEGQRLAFYTPDFFVRVMDGSCFVVETKGRRGSETAVKAIAAREWCESATTEESTWSYVFVPQAIFQQFQGNAFAELASTCAPALYNLTQEKADESLPLFAYTHGAQVEEADAAPTVEGVVEAELLAGLPSRYRRQCEEAISLYRFLESKSGTAFAAVFAPLLGVMDEASRGLIKRCLLSEMPASPTDQKIWFAPYLEQVDRRQQKHYQGVANNLKRTLVFSNGLSPVGLLRNCFDHALDDTNEIGGVFEAVRKQFRWSGVRKVYDAVSRVNDFRNHYVAHQEQQLTDAAVAREELHAWVEALVLISASARA